jgi:ectoine hydroxylase-related dioxygenase (phytanoyl-CoA dioxygenase family)
MNTQQTTGFTFSATHADPAHIAADIATAFAEHGVVVIENAIERSRCDAMREAIERHFAASDTGLAAYRARGGATSVFRCEVWCWNPLVEAERPVPAFVDVLGHDLMNRATAACLGAGWIPSPGCLVMKSAPGGVGQSWHQDCPVGEPHLFNLNRLIYPNDIGAEDGAVVVVPGSHRRGTIPTGARSGEEQAQETFPGEVHLTPRAGTLVLIHGWAWHRVTGNTSRRDRTSINFRAYPAGCPADGPTRYGVYRNGTADHYTGTVIESRGALAGAAR